MAKGVNHLVSLYIQGLVRKTRCVHDYGERNIRLIRRHEAELNACSQKQQKETQEGAEQNLA